MNLLSSYPLGCSLESPSDEGTELLGVAEILAMEDFEFPILFDISDGVGSFVVERGPENGRGYECDLLYGYTLWSETT